jgi:hypothetical protein
MAEKEKPGGEKSPGKEQVVQEHLKGTTKWCMSQAERGRR